MTGPNRSSSKLLWITTGTATALLGAAILFQCFRPFPGTAAEDPGVRANAKDNTSSRTTRAVVNLSMDFSSG